MNFLIDPMALRRIQAAQRFEKYLKREKRRHLSAVYHDCGHGLSRDQFEEVVWGCFALQQTTGTPWFEVTEGPLGGTVLTYIEPTPTSLGDQETTA